MSESDLIKRAMLDGSREGARLFRQNTGLGWAGKVSTLPDGSKLITNPRPLRAGLCRGSSDIIGWTPVEIAGQTVAVFTAIECKTGRQRLTGDQRNFIDEVARAGGLALEARDSVDVIRGLERMRRRHEGR